MTGAHRLFCVVALDCREYTTRGVTLALGGSNARAVLVRLRNTGKSLGYLGPDIVTAGVVGEREGGTLSVASRSSLF